MGDADLGVVVIGRNEGERLVRCLRSLALSGAPVVYVDSGSSDGSVDRARELGVTVVDLDRSRPFSAARARNEGFDRLASLMPGLRLVMFVDGDCEVDPDWFTHARAAIEGRDDVAVVSGRMRERFPEQSIYNRLANLEWDAPVGEATSCGGNALMRADAFSRVGKFDPSATAGEEPELCQRLRAVGYRILRIDAAMLTHDLAMTRFAQWTRRMYRGGYNGLDIDHRFGGADRPFRRELWRARLWAGVWPLVGIALTVAVGFVLGRIGALVVGLGWFSLLPLRVARLARKVRHRVDGPRTALSYGGLTVVGQWVNLLGQGGYVWDRLRGRRGWVIEHKSPPGLAPHA